MSLEIFLVRDVTFLMVCPKCKIHQGTTMFVGTRDLSRTLYHQMKYEHCDRCKSPLEIPRLEFKFVEQTTP